MTSLADQWDGEFLAGGCYGSPLSPAFLREYPAVPWGARLWRLLHSVALNANPDRARYAKCWAHYFHRIRNNWRDAMDKISPAFQREFDGYDGGYGD